jgi:hypothetical protein
MLNLFGSDSAASDTLWSGRVDSRSTGLCSGARDLRTRTAYFPVMRLKSVLYERDFFAWSRQQAGSLASRETR